MIEISLKFLGSVTVASCTIPKEHGREESFCVRESSGAKALSAIIEKLSPFHAGEPFAVSGAQSMQGMVPRKRRAPRRKRQVIWA